MLSRVRGSSGNSTPVSVVALIPARAGSKRIPFKNRLDLGGHPLIWYSVEYALRSLDSDRVIVSSDDPEILRHARDWGVVALERPPEISQDTTPTGAVLQHVLEYCAARTAPEWILLLQPTNPFRPPGLIESALSMIGDSDHSSIFTVSPLKLKFGTRGHEGRFCPVNYRFGQRGQEMEAKYYYENGLLYCTHRKTARDGRVLCSTPRSIVVDTWHADVDIDTPADFEIARALLPRYLEAENPLLQG